MRPAIATAQPRCGLCGKRVTQLVYKTKLQIENKFQSAMAFRIWNFTMVMVLSGYTKMVY
jgi:hypothetical protein